MKRFSMLSLSLCAMSTLSLGCDDPVKDTVLNGLQTGATTIVGSLITAMFQSLMTDTTTTTTSMLDTAAKLVAMVL